MLNWRWLQWVLIPLLVLGAAEWWVRRTADQVPTWYGAAEHLATQGPIGAIFIGSSRVQAAVVPRSFVDALSGRWPSGRQVLNLARGYTTDAEHYLGLRNLLDDHPDALRGVQVFAEAPGGLPFRAGWTDTPWAFKEQPWMLADLLRPADLPTFWRAPGLGFEDRLHLTLRSMLRSARIFNRRERVRQQWWEQALPTLASGQLPTFAPDPQVGADLHGPSPASSIRIDPVAVAHARELAAQTAAALELHEAPLLDWRGSLQEAMAHLVHRHGGRLLFIEPPLSQGFLRAYRTVLRPDVVLFARQAADWGGCVVRPDFPYTDTDLPDLWHLKAELAPAFSRALASAFEQQCSAAVHADLAAR